MRILIAMMVVFTIFMGVGVWTVYSLGDSADFFSEEIEEIMKLAETEQWDMAHQKTLNFKKQWKEKAKWWPMVLDHQEIDNIEFALARTEKYLYTKNIDLSLSQLEELKLMIQHIPEKEAVSIKNIL